MLSEKSQTIADQIFSNDFFKNLDKNTLLQKYDVSGAIDDINAVTRSFSGQNPQPQDGFVISDIPPNGIIITQSGTYRFANSIKWKAENGDGSAIVINADHVVLDMAGFSLTADITDNSKLIVGINVQNAQFVSIQNGILKNMCYYGIYAKSVFELTIDSIMVDGLSFNNLTKGLSPAGILIFDGANLAISSCLVKNLNVISGASAGIQIVCAKNGTVSDCSMESFVNNDGSVQGYSYLLSSKITTKNCISANFQSHFNGNTATLGHTVLGFIPILCIALVYENCNATNMTGCCDDCHGMSVFLDTDIEVNGFTADGVTDGVALSNSGAKATGLEVYGSIVSIKNCTVKNIKAINPQDKQSAGFSVAGTAVSFTNCKAENVIVTDAKGTINPELGYGTGFGWAPDPRPEFVDIYANDILYRNCISTNCQVGFDTWNHIDSVWDDVSCINCGIEILAEPNGIRTLSGNPCSECNPPITVQITNVACGNNYVA
ncbi:right-handed parallel beta-helix repeat-containing protein [Mucilaginibacter paludis]|uniref:Right handed beta helix domain-containing protein n=1 Tax=Mucilaginibacter paludis DSM 18603 TaxID=714943 RepID=H1Y360_9SPHI|nr:hypothetical protein [Mucilaginibacter paludis]EHQ28878.1 hypothetical protein Mucpa_4793 [Mucilaginibacter paludis DSM 18603]